MSDFYIEERSPSRVISWDIAHHLFTRYMQGIVVVVCDSPNQMLSAISKQWRQVILSAERERSSTLNQSRVHELSYRIMNMKRLRMVASEMHLSEFCDVFFVTPEQAYSCPPICQTIYITAEISHGELKKITSQMLSGSLVVRYAS